GKTLYDAAYEIGPGLAGAALCGYVNDEMVDLNHVITEDAKINIVTERSDEALDVLRHSTAHLMAQAVMHLFPEVKIAIGPNIENGFYYDFDVDEPFTPEDFSKIEKKMKELSKEKVKIEREDLSSAEAIKLFKELDEPYKVELIEDLGAETVSVYRQGDFVDLCRGPHVPSTNKLKVFKIISNAGAYWRGDENKKMLQRIYGTAFFKKADLKDHLHKLEEAKKRDHRKVGKDLELFSIQDEAGAGLVIWHPKGAMLRHLLENFEKKEHIKRGYDLVVGPQILKVEMWKQSGHFDNYRENMYFTEVDEQQYGIKPMNCLAHMLIYKSKMRSYRDLPKRYFELGTVHRHERTGVLHGLMRVRGFTQDDAHILCTPEQLLEEITSVIDFVNDIMDIFGFEYEMELSTRPEKSIGSDEDWDLATNALKEALISTGRPYDLNEGDGAFYGPKIDIKLKDVLDRKWQCATIQCDFTLPDRFDLSYIGQDGEKHRPVMLHRVILGSIERFIGVLTEHFAGAFPVWIAPTQAIVIPVSEKYDDYAKKVFDDLKAADIRVELESRNEKLGYKIREAQLMKIPYMLIVGDKEKEAGGVSPRKRTGEDLKLKTIKETIDIIEEDVNLRR
ncbi:threonine--tRNA ligase, partial [Thermodesulfobacteriota bacterium]